MELIVIAFIAWAIGYAALLKVDLYLNGRISAASLVLMAIAALFAPLVFLFLGIAWLVIKGNEFTVYEPKE